MKSRSVGEEKFIAEMTRKKLALWADIQLSCTTDELPTPQVWDLVYVEHAKEKGWVTKRTPLRVTSKGFAAAAAFLRR